jgi:amidase
VLAEPPGGSTHSGVAAVARSAADLLADDGFDVTEVAPPDYERAIELWQGILSVDLRVQQPVLSRLMGPDGRRFLDLFLDNIATPDVVGAALLHTERYGLARRWNEWFEQYPILLTPVWTQPAFEVGFDIASVDSAAAVVELMRPVMPANLLGTPAAVVPAGAADGVPVGLQVMGPRFSDLRCLAVAETIEGHLGLPTPLREFG